MVVACVGVHATVVVVMVILGGKRMNAPVQGLNSDVPKGKKHIRQEHQHRGYAVNPPVVCACIFHSLGFEGRCNHLVFDEQGQP
jgi:hypothetical protein